jgi:hypothetical protein
MTLPLATGTTSATPYHLNANWLATGSDSLQRKDAMRR